MAQLLQNSHLLLTTLKTYMTAGFKNQSTQNFQKNMRTTLILSHWGMHTKVPERSQLGGCWVAQENLNSRPTCSCFPHALPTLQLQMELTYQLKDNN